MKTPPGYRKLECGEIIKHGDKWLLGETLWDAVSVGAIVLRTDLIDFFRPLTETTRKDLADWFAASDIGFRLSQSEYDELTRIFYNLENELHLAKQAAAQADEISNHYNDEIARHNETKARLADLEASIIST
jgi:hypothetical protein